MNFFASCFSDILFTNLCYINIVIVTIVFLILDVLLHYIFCIDFGIFYHVTLFPRNTVFVNTGRDNNKRSNFCIHHTAHTETKGNGVQGARMGDFIMSNNRNSQCHSQAHHPSTHQAEHHQAQHRMHPH